MTTKPCPACGVPLHMPEPPSRISRHELVRLVAHLLPGAAYDDWTPDAEAEAKLDEVMPGWRERVGCAVIWFSRSRQAIGPKRPRKTC